MYKTKSNKMKTEKIDKKYPQKYWGKNYQTKWIVSRLTKQILNPFKIQQKPRDPEIRLHVIKVGHIFLSPLAEAKPGNFHHCLK